MNFSSYKLLVHGPKVEKMSGDRFYRLERNISVRLSYVVYRFFSFIRPTDVTFFSYFLLALVFFSSFFGWAREWVVLFGVIQLGLLYTVTMTDKVDGELSRAKDFQTQAGIYHDRGVHFLYPFVFYFTIGHFFYVQGVHVNIIFLTLLLGLLTQKFVFLREAKLLVKDTIQKHKLDVKDWILVKKKSRHPLPFVFRVIDYLTFMIYAWTLFYYVLTFIVFLWSPTLSAILFLGHMAITFCILLYRLYWWYPKKKLFKKDTFTHL